MIFPRLRLLLFVACGLCSIRLFGQEGTGAGTGTGTSSSGSSTGGGASSSFGTPSTGSSSNPFSSAVPTAPSSPSSAAPSFRTGGPETAPAPTLTEPPPLFGQPGAASTFGTEQTSPGMTRTPPATFTVPGFYGRGAQQFTVGEGRLARPRFRTNVNVSMGYDDNVFQTPTRPQSTRDQKIPILVSPGSPATTAIETVPSGDPLVPDTQREVEVPAVAPKFRYERIPGTPAPQRIGSFVTRSSLGFEMQFASRRDLFTFNFDGGTTYYWNRPGKKYEYTGALQLIYLRKLTGRAQFTMAMDLSYQSQPNFSQVNSPTNNNRGSYLSTNIKADLSYRLTPRFSSVTSVSYNSIFSVEESEQGSDFGETTFGTELRYLFSPRITLLGELRYSSSLHDLDPAQDTTTTFLLIGGEITLTRRFNASLRIGEALRTYTEGGGTSSSPYVETTLAYRLARGTVIQWNGRYGYEESGVADNETIVARTGLNLTHIFSPRLQASLALNLVHTQNTATTQVLVTDGAGASDPADPAAPAAPADETAVPETRTVEVETTQDTIDATVGLQYTLSRRWSFNLNYTYTMAIGPVETSDYYRQQIFLGAQMQF